MSFDQLLSGFEVEACGRAQDCSASDFIQATIKAGYNVGSEARQSILRDISDILACNAEDLSFLYEIAPQEDSTLKVPCVKALLGLVTDETRSPLPYRANDIANFNEAAE